MHVGYQVGFMGLTGGSAKRRGTDHTPMDGPRSRSGAQDYALSHSIEVGMDAPVPTASRPVGSALRVAQMYVNNKGPGFWWVFSGTLAPRWSFVHGRMGRLYVFGEVGPMQWYGGFAEEPARHERPRTYRGYTAGFGLGAILHFREWWGLGLEGFYKNFRGSHAFTAEWVGAALSLRAWF